MTRKSIKITEQVYDYLLSVSLTESAILQECREYTDKQPLARMQIAPEQGQFFKFLIESLQVQTAIEIGVFTGYSSLAIALALPEAGRLVACEKEPEFADVASRFWEKAGVRDKVELRIGPALDTLDQLFAEEGANSFDFAFIDAHKPEYIDYYEKLMRLIRPGGVIAIDNVLWDGYPADPQRMDEDTVAIRDFNQHIYRDERITLSMLPLADGVSLALKK